MQTNTFSIIFDCAAIMENKLKYELNRQQKRMLKKLHHFINGRDRTFIYKEYVGTDLVPLLSCLFEMLTEEGYTYHLAAPTGRVASILRDKTGEIVSDVHKIIYSFGDIREYLNHEGKKQEPFKFCFALRPSSHITDDVFIICESSMISDIPAEDEYIRFGSGRLLKDLLDFVGISDPEKSSKIIFIGDPAQLPPVGMDFSPALDENYLHKEFNLEIASGELIMISRQNHSSLLRENASRIRESLLNKKFGHFWLKNSGNEVFNTLWADYLDLYFKTRGEKILVCYKNKTATKINREIREKLYPGKKLPQPGDKIFIAASNYFLGLYNGQFATVVSYVDRPVSRVIHTGTENIKLRWQSIRLLLKDEDGSEREILGYYLLNFLHSENNNLTSSERMALYIDFLLRHPGIKPGQPAFAEWMKKDFFAHPLLLKYAYAITGHDLQGGEWDHVFIAWDYGTGINHSLDESPANEFLLRWAYTSMTRSVLSLINILPPQAMVNGVAECALYQIIKIFTACHSKR